MAETIRNTQIEQLRPFRDRLGDATFQSIQCEVWYRFSRKAPPIYEGHLAPLALVGVWGELIRALELAVQQQTPQRESGRSAVPPRNLLWEMVKTGVTWGATLTFRSEEHVWEVELSRNGVRSSTRRFSTCEKAEAWAEQQCAQVSTGWKE